MFGFIKTLLGVSFVVGAIGGVVEAIWEELTGSRY